MVLLDRGGTLLPEGLQFLKPGWWLLHLLVVGLVFAYGYRRGRAQERREQRSQEKERKSR